MGSFNVVDAYTNLPITVGEDVVMIIANSKNPYDWNMPHEDTLQHYLEQGLVDVNDPEDQRYLRSKSRGNHLFLGVYNDYGSIDDLATHYGQDDEKLDENIERYGWTKFFLSLPTFEALLTYYSFKNTVKNPLADLVNDYYHELQLIRRAFRETGLSFPFHESNYIGQGITANDISIQRFRLAVMSYQLDEIEDEHKEAQDDD